MCASSQRPRRSYLPNSAEHGRAKLTVDDNGDLEEQVLIDQQERKKKAAVSTARRSAYFATRYAKKKMDAHHSSGKRKADGNHMARDDPVTPFATHDDPVTPVLRSRSEYFAVAWVASLFCLVKNCFLCIKKSGEGMAIG
jgi:hypothetical protein